MLTREKALEVLADPDRLDHGVLVAGTAAVFAAIWHTFSGTSVMYFRDLAHYSLPFTRWMRRTVASGHLPLWNPDSGLGFSAISDPTLQLLFPPTVLLRLLLPETLGFNLATSLAIPAAFLGAFLLFRCRRADMSAATAGAAVFALSGPMLSAANMHNLGWSAALAPWVVLAAARSAESPDRRRTGALAIAVGLQALAGEPVTLAATIAVAVAVAIFDRPASVRWVPMAVCLGAGLLLGGLLASIQLIPVAVASLGSARGAGAIIDTWSIRPVALVETVMAGLFGSPLEPAARSPVWYRAMNGGRDPLLLSLYVGLPALVLAGAALGDSDSRRRRSSFVWMAAVCGAIVLALGDSTPILPMIRDHVPGGSLARFPAKFACTAVLGVSVLVCAGVGALRGESADRRASRVALWCTVPGIAAALGAILAGSAPSSSGLLAGWSGAAGVPLDGPAARQIAEAIVSGGVTLLALGVLTAVAILLLRSGRVAPALRGPVLAIMAFLPLVIAAPWRLIPVMPRADLADPPWAAGVDPAGRVFVSAGDGLAYSADVAPGFRPDPESPRAEAGSKYGALFPVYATGIGLRDAVTTDLALLRPQPYALLLGRYATATPLERRRALGRLGVTDLIVPFEPAPPDATLRQRIEALPAMAHWSLSGASPRVQIVTGVERIAVDSDQISRFFTESYDPSADVILESLAGEVPETRRDHPRDPAATTPDDGSAAPSPESSRDAVAVVAESPNTIVIRAIAPQSGGWLVVNDAWSEGWSATVDGANANVLRANGIVRAVRLESGAHTVRMSYRPFALVAGAVLSAMSLLVIALLFIGSSLFRRITAPQRRSGINGAEPSG